jgi:hypothetical protein
MVLASSKGFNSIIAIRFFIGKSYYISLHHLFHLFQSRYFVFLDLCDCLDRKGANTSVEM